MAKITNPGRRDLTLPTRHVVPRMGELVTTNEMIQQTDNWPILNGMMLAGDIAIEFDPDPDAEMASPVYATDPVAPEPLTTGKQPVYPTDPVPVEPEPVVDTPVYPTDPLPPPAPVAPEVAPAEPDLATGPVDLPADAILAKSKK